METDNPMLWVRLGFGLVIGLVFTCVVFTICKVRQDIANTNDDVVIPIYQSSIKIYQNRLVIGEERSRTIPQDGSSARNV